MNILVFGLLFLNPYPIYQLKLQNKLQRVVNLLCLSILILLQSHYLFRNKSACIDDKQLEL